MSQNKTVIQGITPEDNSNNSASGGFYSRSKGSAASRGTVVPGMSEAQSDRFTPNPESGSGRPDSRKCKSTTGATSQTPKPIIGFLYSISRTPMGEYWPLVLGSNKIGQAIDSDIQLAEGTVSREHAVIGARLVKGKLIAAIKDNMSSNGTMINGEAIGFTPEECHNGDIITIGNNYEFVVVLIDAPSRGLAVSQDFVSTEIVQEDEEDDDDFDIPFGPYNGPTSWGNAPDGGNYSHGGTVGLDGSAPGNQHGGTVPI